MTLKTSFYDFQALFIDPDCAYFLLFNFFGNKSKLIKKVETLSDQVESKMIE